MSIRVRASGLRRAFPANNHVKICYHKKMGDLTREPEMVKAYRDTWNLGIQLLSNLSANESITQAKSCWRPGEHLRQLAIKNLQCYALSV